MGLQMRNGPQTWPLISHGSLGWMQQCDGEISPRYYTALIRRASSLQYRPKHFLSYHSDGFDYTDLNIYKRSGDNRLNKRNLTYLKGVRLKDESRACIEKQDLHYIVDYNSRTNLRSDSLLHYCSENSADVYSVRNNRLSKSFKSMSNQGLVKDFDLLSIDSNKHHGKCKHKSQLYVKLSSGSHLSESDDFQSCGTLKRNSKYLLKHSNMVNSRVQKKDQPSRHSLKSTTDRHFFSCHSIKELDLTSSETAPLNAVSPLSHKKYALVSHSLLSSPSSSDVSACQKLVCERPYYDCGYETDYESTPPHSSVECADGKLQVADASPVWSRYLSWLQRMTKTQG